MSGKEARQRKIKGSGSATLTSSNPLFDEDYDSKQKYTHSCTWTILRIIFMVFFSVFLILLVLPAPIDPVAHSFPNPPAAEGNLARNEILSKAHRLFENEVVGPESIVFNGDHIYTGTADGKILEIYKGEIRVVTRLGKEPCGRFQDEPTCGRPLGMRFDRDGYLIVCDAYLGLFKVNVATGNAHVLWPHTAPIDGKPAKLFNAVVTASDGMIYFTDSSTKWDRRHNRYQILEIESSGRLVSYDPVTNTTLVLASGLAFANGLELSRNEEFLVMAETGKFRVWKYHLKGDNKGKLEVFSDNLPGLPDNIQKSSTGGFWVGFAGVRWRDKISMLDFSAPYPWLKKLVTKIVPQETLVKVMPKYGLAIELDQRGNVVRSLHDPTGQKISAACDVADKDGILYLGSYSLPYLGKLYLKQFTKKT